MRIELYTFPRCRGSPEAKELVRKLKEENPKLDLRVIDISEEGGVERFL